MIIPDNCYKCDAYEKWCNNKISWEKLVKCCSECCEKDKLNEGEQK